MKKVENRAKNTAQNLCIGSGRIGPYWRGPIRRIVQYGSNTTGDKKTIKSTLIPSYWPIRRTFGPQAKGGDRIVPLLRGRRLSDTKSKLGFYPVGV